MGVLTAWATAVALQTARDVRVDHRMPVPSEFVASGVVFSALAVVGTASPGIAGVLAWGLLIGVALQAYGSGSVPVNLQPSKTRGKGE